MNEQSSEPAGELALIVEATRKLAARYDLDYWCDHDRRKAFPAAFYQALCEAGLIGIALPEAAGGAGLGVQEMALVIEELAASAAGPTAAQLFMMSAIFGGVALSKYGSEAHRRELLPGLITGEVRTCLALTEPNAGSNALNIATFATATDGGWSVSGQKIWISAVPNSNKMLLVARTAKPGDSADRSAGLSLFLIDIDRPGLTHSPIEKLGTNTVPSSMVFLDGVPVRHDELIGQLHNGWKQLLDILNTERIVSTAGLVGTVGLAIRLAVAYANERRVFGRTPIAAYQGVQFPLAQAYAEAQCARALNLAAARRFDEGQPFGSEANMAKLIAAQAAMKATEHAMQAMGGMGYARESHLERLWRDCRLFRFAPVPEELILSYIANHDLGMARGY